MTTPYSPEITSHAEVISVLKTLSFFKDMPQAAFVHFAAKAHIHEDQKGKVVFLHGDNAACFYVVINGWIKLFRDAIDGTEAVFDMISVGHICGETSIFNDNIHTYSAEIVEDASYIALPTSLLSYYIDKEKTMAMNMMEYMAKQQQVQSRDLEHSNIQHAPQRIGCFLLRLCPDAADGEITLSLPYSKLLIASRIGMKPETFSRALSILKQATGLTVKGGQVVIPDITVLKNYTCLHCSQHVPCAET